ncbi:MAG: hypothetical protein JKY54_18105 [Flavobacteriales bacterium]|nr:hypothetical protein [Flavobacteriales bacterium]
MFGWFSYEDRIAPMVQAAGLMMPVTAMRYGKSLKNTINAGVLAITKPILSETNYKKLVEMLNLDAWRNLGDSIFTDQKVINRFFEGQIAITSSQYNYMIFLNDYLKYIDKVSFQEAKLIHFAGRIKPWNNYNKEELIKKAPHYLKYIEVWRELLSDLRNQGDINFQAQSLLNQYKWTENGANYQLEENGRIY